jgi:hypothetical protein
MCVILVKARLECGKTFYVAIFFPPCKLILAKFFCDSCEVHVVQTNPKSTKIWLELQCQASQLKFGWVESNAWRWEYLDHLSETCMHDHLARVAFSYTQLMSHMHQRFICWQICGRKLDSLQSEVHRKRKKNTLFGSFWYSTYMEWNKKTRKWVYKECGPLVQGIIKNIQPHTGGLVSKAFFYD